MAITLYSSIDLKNKVVLANSFTNASNIGGPDPNINVSGSLSDSGYSMPGSVPNKSEDMGFNYELQYDVDHSSPLNPVPPNAVITKVTMQMQTASPSIAGNTSITFASEPVDQPADQRGGTTTSGVTIAAIIEPLSGVLGVGVVTAINVNGSNSSSPAGPGLKTSSKSLNPAGIIIGFEIDYTTNPGGLYPLGYATYAQFISDFAQILFAFNFDSTLSTVWTQFESGLGHPTPATGTVTASGTLIVNNFSMEADWNVPLAWTVAPATLNVPPDVITITRPDPGVPPDQDTGMLDSITIGPTKIEPNDPWVIIWTTLTIIIHIPPDTPAGSITIYGEVIGTEFTGNVPLGTITISYTDLSGIYTFDTTVHTDQLYTRTTTSSTVTTQLVMIPAPFFVTAFFHDEDEEVMHFTGVRIRATGQGNLKQVMQSLDTIYTEQLADLTLMTANATQPFVLSNFVNQDAALRVYMDSTSDYMAVSKLIMYMNPLYSGYPQ